MEMPVSGGTRLSVSQLLIAKQHFTWLPEDAHIGISSLVARYRRDIYFDIVRPERWKKERRRSTGWSWHKHRTGSGQCIYRNMY